MKPEEYTELLERAIYAAFLATDRREAVRIFEAMIEEAGYIFHLERKPAQADLDVFRLGAVR